MKNPLQDSYRQELIPPMYHYHLDSSMDLKVMPKLYKGHKFILCIIDEVTNYLITIPIQKAKSEETGDALIENIITKYCIPEYVIIDQDSMFMSFNYLFHKFHIKIETVAPHNQ